MTRSQRLWHRRAWLSLALVFPLVLAIAMVVKVQHARVFLAAQQQRKHAP